MGVDMPDMVEFTRLFLALFFTMVAVFYTSRIFIMKRVTSRSLVFPGERYCSTWWNHMTFRFFRVLIWMVCLFRYFFPELDGYLGLINALQTNVVIAVGLVLLSLGFFATIAMNWAMGEEWRSGIDPSGPSQLLSNGVYHYSRNPMFVCIGLAQLGFFLALPSIFSLVCLIVGWMMLYRQTLAEEQHLADKFPQEYASYTATVRRWV